MLNHAWSTVFVTIVFTGLVVDAASTAENLVTLLAKVTDQQQDRALDVLRNISTETLTQLSTVDVKKFLMPKLKRLIGNDQPKEIKSEAARVIADIVAEFGKYSPVEDLLIDSDVTKTMTHLLQSHNNAIRKNVLRAFTNILDVKKLRNDAIEHGLMHSLIESMERGDDNEKGVAFALIGRMIDSTSGSDSELLTKRLISTLNDQLLSANPDTSKNATLILSFLVKISPPTLANYILDQNVASSAISQISRHAEHVPELLALLTELVKRVPEFGIRLAGEFDIMAKINQALSKLIGNDIFDLVVEKAIQLVREIIAVNNATPIEHLLDKGISKLVEHTLKKPQDFLSTANVDFIREILTLAGANQTQIVCDTNVKSQLRKIREQWSNTFLIPEYFKQIEYWTN